MVKALKTLSVEPVMVMILSGQEPSEMLTRAQLCGAVSRHHFNISNIIFKTTEKERNKETSLLFFLAESKTTNFIAEVK